MRDRGTQFQYSFDEQQIIYKRSYIQCDTVVSANYTVCDIISEKAMLLVTGKC
jgi:hypothetical protein